MPDRRWIHRQGWPLPELMPQDLMLRFQAGDEEAFKQLVLRFQEPIASFAFRLLNDHEKALDVAQETFISVYTHAESYRPIAGFSAWIYRIAYNLAINELRRQKRQPSFSIDIEEDAEGGSPKFELAGTGASAEDEILGREKQAAVRRCVASLPMRYRTAVVMKDMEGLTFEEIAGILHCPESTVKSRVVRARRMLLKRLEPYLSGARDGPVSGD